jgi:hypothetical protein
MHAFQLTVHFGSTPLAKHVRINRADIAGVYIDEEGTGLVIRKVPITELGYICIERRNKKIVSLVALDDKADIRECFTFAVDKVSIADLAGLVCVSLVRIGVVN